MYLVVDSQLVFENLVPSFIDGVRSNAIILPPGINWAPFAVPDTKAILVHPFPLLLVRFLHSLSLFVRADIVLWTSRKAVSTIVCRLYKMKSWKQ